MTLKDPFFLKGRGTITKVVLKGYIKKRLVLQKGDTGRKCPHLNQPEEVRTKYWHGLGYVIVQIMKIRHTSRNSYLIC